MAHIYESFIDKVAKPARYLGGEYQSVVKDHEACAVTLCLAFPDVYEIGMSHMGTKILYSLLNKDRAIAVERCFAPWVDMEAELRARKLALVSLESQTPLVEFDVVGLSLQYELTYSNVLTILDLGGIPLLARERSAEHPLVLGGGPNATHPEPMAPFFDGFFIGEAEEELASLLKSWGELKRAGGSRLEALAELAQHYPLYVPALYSLAVDVDTGMQVVGAPLEPRVPERVRRGVVANIDDYPFPSDTPVPYAEAVFDRAGVEIARGCTEGCRFCQAGMIYRPVRERSPESIVKTLIDGVEQAGYDETSLTSLSTADYSAITPLVRKVASELKERKVSLSVSSLRAYGLGEEILDAMASMRITGLTFAPEAGTQRMRDVVNKNVFEHHIEESSERIFTRGWQRIKLYFMIGLPTEEDIDVRGIVETGQRMLAIGRKHLGKRAEVVVSVSSHVPKPHTPFQWCAQDSIEEIARKQQLLRNTVSQRNLRLKYHDRGISYLEGIISRGDRRIAEAILQAWKRGARFDGWDEHCNLELWNQVFGELKIDTSSYLGTRPVSARLPWDHIDVGLEDGFLLREYRKALKGRLSPPCGKVAGELIHKSNLQEATSETKRLVCYDCGVACDLRTMRKDRLRKLETLGAFAPRQVVNMASKPRQKHDKPASSFVNQLAVRYRLRYSKIARSALLGHLDTARMLMRLFRRAGIRVAYTEGFHPKPRMHFAPALPLGVASLGELVDVHVEDTWSADELCERLEQVAPPGICFTGGWALGEGEASLAKLITSFDLAVVPTPDGVMMDKERLTRLANQFLAKESALVERKSKKNRVKTLDIRSLVGQVRVLDKVEAHAICELLEWSAVASMFLVQVEVHPLGSARPAEIARALGVDGGADNPWRPRARLARIGFDGAFRSTGIADRSSVMAC